MKTLLTLFVLLFSSCVIADDISDFEIEGIFLGDSLFDHFTEREINNAYSFKYKNDEYRYYTFDVDSLIYDYLQITIKTDNEYIDNSSSQKSIIHAIAGMIEYKNNINECYKKQKEVKKDLDSFLNAFDVQEGSRVHPADESGQSKIIYVYYFLEPGSESFAASIQCYDIGKDFENQGYEDLMRISIYTQDFRKFIDEVHYQ